MERTPLEEHTELHDIVTGLYNLVFEDDLRSNELRLYDIESEYVEAEIDFPYIGINRRKWAEWSPERRLEVLLHEFAHVEEGEDDLDHDPAFYERLTDLATVAQAHGSAVEALFGASLDFEEAREHIVDSVNEYTIEPEIDSVETRRCVLREAFGSSGEAEASDA